EEFQRVQIERALEEYVTPILDHLEEKVSFEVTDRIAAAMISQSIWRGGGGTKNLIDKAVRDGGGNSEAAFISSINSRSENASRNKGPLALVGGFQKFDR